MGTLVIVGNWLADNWVWLLPLINPLASAICATTPTPKDDDIWGKAYKVLEVLALNLGKAKQLPGQSNAGKE